MFVKNTFLKILVAAKSAECSPVLTLNPSPTMCSLVQKRAHSIPTLLSSLKTTWHCQATPNFKEF